MTTCSSVSGLAKKTHSELAASSAATERRVEGVAGEQHHITRLGFQGIGGNVSPGDSKRRLGKAFSGKMEVSVERLTV